MFEADVQAGKQFCALKNFSSDHSQRSVWFSELLSSMTKFAMILNYFTAIHDSQKLMVIISTRSDEALTLTWFMMSHFPIKPLTEQKSQKKYLTMHVILVNESVADYLNQFTWNRFSFNT